MWKLRIGTLMISGALGLGGSTASAWGYAGHPAPKVKSMAGRPLAQPVLALEMAISAQLTRHGRQVHKHRHKTVRHVA